MQRFRDLISWMDIPGQRECAFRLLFCGFNFCDLPVIPRNPRKLDPSKISGYTVYVNKGFVG